QRVTTLLLLDAVEQRQGGALSLVLRQGLQRGREPVEPVGIVCNSRDLPTRCRYPIDERVHRYAVVMRIDHVKGLDPRSGMQAQLVDCPGHEVHWQSVIVGAGDALAVERGRGKAREGNA